MDENFMQRLAALDYFVHRNPDVEHVRRWDQGQKDLERVIVGSVHAARIHRDEDKCELHGCPGVTVMAMATERLENEPAVMLGLLCMAITMLAERVDIPDRSREDIESEHVHPVCDGCAPEGNWIRNPVREEETCCICGQMNNSGLYFHGALSEKAICQIGREELKVPDVIPTEN